MNEMQCESKVFFAIIHLTMG